VKVNEYDADALVSKYLGGASISELSTQFPLNQAGVIAELKMLMGESVYKKEAQRRKKIKGKITEAAVIDVTEFHRMITSRWTAEGMKKHNKGVAPL
jgi:hypothetical protein